MDQDVRASFREMLQRVDRELDLAEAALLIAQEEYPDLDRARYLRALDALGEEAARRVGNAASPHGAVNALSGYLFDEEKFHGNEQEYYDPRNSYLNEVLDRRLGIPITLSLVYIEVGRRAGMSMDGVGMPGHFLVRYRTGDEEILVDAFHRGIMLQREDCATLLAGTSGYTGEFRDELLAPVTKRQFLARLLNNLRGIYLAGGDYGRALAAVERMLIVDREGAEDLRLQAAALRNRMR
jgi:regulator of sirC expression with transglutaminase-like and TPR domain